MNTGSLTLDFFLLMLIVYKPCLYGNEAENCSIDVTIKRETKISSISGDSVTIECPVKYCHKQPKVNWLKYNARLQDFFILHTGQNHNESWINGNIFVLKFPYINRNDSGLYRCEATLEGNTTAGHAIEVVVQDYRNITGFEGAKNTTKGHAASEKNKILIVYILSSLGALGLLFVCCFGLLQSKRRHQVKNKTTSSTLEIEMNEVCDYKNVKYCSDATSHVSNEGSVPPLQLFPDDSATHNNLSICKKSNRTASKPTCDKSVTNQLLPTNQDILVYATLNHKEYFQGSNLFVETDFTEYAAIMVKT
ncbi:B- and T-lymphocyte attenuator isoform X2 [Anolis carolinensis]|uniref:B and T lymphocyte associated n=1 Tax=Anolis carolinensis TaxID=28377 RepID=G1KY75_ANOCA|nr:PREDICTED: B- and T-lymphocyte attenuator isoform X2 [Anolis carolinensis]|eukprot:XP_008105957.1 PREDICTED: B- and T-lymphocyte attenuator isoform X2 [Anolis carolinensis]